MNCKLSQEIVIEEIKDQGLLLYNNKTKETQILNETAKFVFELCDGNGFEVIITEFLKRYSESVPKEELIKACINTLNIFVQKDILSIV